MKKDSTANRARQEAIRSARAGARTLQELQEVARRFNLNPGWASWVWNARQNKQAKKTGHGI